MSLRKGLRDCPGCKLVVAKLADDYAVDLQPDDIPALVHSLTAQDAQLRDELAAQRRSLTHLDAEKTKENTLLSIELWEAERLLQQLSDELRNELDDSHPSP